MNCEVGVRKISTHTPKPWTADQMKYLIAVCLELVSNDSHYIKSTMTWWWNISQWKWSRNRCPIVKFEDVKWVTAATTWVRAEFPPRTAPRPSRARWRHRHHCRRQQQPSNCAPRSRDLGPILFGSGGRGNG